MQYIAIDMDMEYLYMSNLNQIDFNRHQSVSRSISRCVVSPVNVVQWQTWPVVVECQLNSNSNP